MIVIRRVVREDAEAVVDQEDVQRSELHTVQDREAPADDVRLAARAGRNQLAALAGQVDQDGPPTPAARRCHP